MIGWQKARLGEYLIKENTRLYDLAEPEKLDVYGVSNVEGITKTSHVQSADLSNYILIEPRFLAYNPYRINVGSIGLTPEGIRGVVSPAYVVFRTDTERLLPEILYDFLKSKSGISEIRKIARGTVRQALRYEDLCKIEMIIPPIEDQIKILFKKKIFDKKINCFLAANKLVESHLTLLRQQILQDAISGKLTADWRMGNPNVEPASELLKRIKAEKERLIAEKKIKKEKPIPPIKDEEKPLELPDGWGFVRLGEIAKIGTGATPLTSMSEYYKNGNINWITSSATNNDFVYEAEKKITQKALDETNCQLFPSGTLVVAMYGQGKTRGQITELLIEAATNQACATINFFVEDENEKKYIKVLFQRQYEEIRKLASGGAQPNLNMIKIRNTLVPIPPLAEQQAVVVKVEKLMALVDRLEARIAENANQADLLMQTFLAEVFTDPSADE